MSVPIRPLPKEAAPQRTESDASSGNKSDSPAFGEILQSAQLESPKDAPADDKARRYEPAPEKKPDNAIELWSLLAFLPTAIPSIPAETNVSSEAPPEANAVSIPGNLRPPLPVSASSISTDSKPATPEIQNASTTLPDPTAKPELKQAFDLSSEKGAEHSKQRIEMLRPSTADSAEETNQRAPRPTPGLPDLKPSFSPETAEIATHRPLETQKADGTPDAKQPVMLLDVEKFSTPGSDEQQKPLSHLESYTVSERPILPVRAATRHLDVPGETSMEKLAFQPGNFSSPIRADGALPLEAPHASDLRSLTLVESVQDQVQILRASQQTELRVVLRPDPHTELLLQLRHVDGQVHLEARCQRGDFAWLDSQWSAVQNALSTQGVRVEPLQSASSTNQDAPSMFARDDRGSQGDRRPAASFFQEQEYLSPRKILQGPKTPASRPRGWQSWA